MGFKLHLLLGLGHMHIVHVLITAQLELGPTGLGLGWLATPLPPPSGVTLEIVRFFGGVDGVLVGSESEVRWVIEMVGLFGMFTMAKTPSEEGVWLQGRGVPLLRKEEG